ncbi:hypothetical protein BE221DRAFT_189807 [Ostreococcus tauri]|uniref:E3 ubiquitin-protein ligase CHFR n=1 Tax=Ostreococcus tauri TaxID=70448 RepID=A0A1Y5IK42_OSTTA|nr:hypothetical protein BE221DRAFT_189807 [Ostreococcus tauri]
MSEASSGPCALVLIEDPTALDGADVPEHIALQPLRRRGEGKDDDTREVPGLPRASDSRVVITIGRDATKVDVAMDCTTIPLLLSRRHAHLTCDGDAHYVRDLATTNGTFVNGSRIEAKSDVALRDGDVVAFGGPRYVARNAGKLANPFRFRYVALERAGVDAGDARTKRQRLSQGSEREFGLGGVEVSAQASQVYQPLQGSQTSETDEELDDELKARLRRVFEGEDAFAQACAKRYFGVVSPVESPLRKAKDATAPKGVTRGFKSAHQSPQSADDDEGLKEKLTQLVVERLRDRPMWMESELKCGICHEWMTNPHSVITCGHTFCLECVDNSFCHSYTCPLCRSRPSAPREFLFAPATLATKLLEEYVIPTLTTKELQLRRAKDTNAKEARDRRVKRATELLSSATRNRGTEASAPETQFVSPQLVTPSERSIP